jgi:type III secretory pathway component EscV
MTDIVLSLVTWHQLEQVIVPSLIEHIFFSLKRYILGNSFRKLSPPKLIV